jgi:UrcA family protein
VQYSLEKQLNVGQRHRDTDTPLQFRSFPMRFALPLIALAAIAAPAFAAPVAGETVTVRIAYGDVDLTSAEGRAALEARIDAKLRKACASDSTARYTIGRTAIDAKCVADARATALAEVDRVAAAEARSGRAVAAN